MAEDIEVTGTPPVNDASALEVLSREQCLALLRTKSLGRLGVSVNALPQILPVNFAMLDEDVVIRSVPGTKLDAAVAQQVVAFEVDDHGDDGTWGWSVLIVGFGAEITDPAELAEAQAVELQAWAVDGRADRYLRIESTVVSGRRFDHR